MGYVVTTPLVIVRDESGASHHFYEGASVPDGMDKDHLKQLVDGGMIEGVKAATDESPEDSQATPAKSAAKAEWVEYAVTRGASQDEAEGLTKVELVEQYGG